MPHVATSPADLLSVIRDAAHLDGDLLLIDDEAAFRDDRDPRPRLDRRIQHRRPDDRHRPVARLGGQPGARRPVGEHPGPVRRPAVVARSRASPCRPSTSAPRRSTWHAPSTRRPRPPTSGPSSSSWPAASRPTRSSARSTTRPPCWRAPIAAGWRGPVFIQGDHYQFNAKKYAADPEAMTEEIRRACRLAVEAGYRNIDIDSSTLVDLSKPTTDEQQHENYARAAELTALIRTLETDGVTISVGGEIGEVGTQNSTVEELRAYLDGYRRELEARMPGAVGISKVSVQTGTSHGGVPLPDGGVAEVKLDFEVLRELGEVARRDYGLAGAVQHGASTLPDELFHRFPAVETAEIHLATGFQNALYEHPAFPEALHREIEAWCFGNAADERKAGQTDQQFVYTTRKKAIGPFKRQLWDLADQGRDPRGPAAQDRVPVHGARRQRIARDGRRRTSGPVERPSTDARRPARGRRGGLTGAAFAIDRPREEPCRRRPTRPSAATRWPGGSGPRSSGRSTSRPSTWATASGCIAPWPRAGRRRRPNWPSAPGSTRATPGSGSSTRQSAPSSTSTTWTRPPMNGATRCRPATRRSSSTRRASPTWRRSPGSWSARPSACPTSSPRTGRGGGVDWADYGPDVVEAQEGVNRPQFAHLVGDWIDALPDIAARLRDGQGRVADVACGTGWSSISIARALPRDRRSTASTSTRARSNARRPMPPPRG